MLTTLQKTEKYKTQINQEGVTYSQYRNEVGYIRLETEVGTTWTGGSAGERGG